MIINQGAGGGLDLTGTTDQVVGFNADGKPTPVSKEELRGPQGIPGADGEKGADGKQGPAGKTAYQYAVDGGYTGTEEQFKALMGTGPWLPLKGGTMQGDITLPYYQEENGTYSARAIKLAHNAYLAQKGVEGVVLGTSNNLVVPRIFRDGFGFFNHTSLPKNQTQVLAGIAEPKYESDAASKGYVDKVFGGKAPETVTVGAISEDTQRLTVTNVSAMKCNGMIYVQIGILINQRDANFEYSSYIDLTGDFAAVGSMIGCTVDTPIAGSGNTISYFYANALFASGDPLIRCVWRGNGITSNIISVAIPAA